MARGIDDVVVAVVASPQSTVIGGATQTVRDLVAVWEERDVMAREVAVDVASHSPQVDPILDDLTEALADITPLTPEVPYYSATLFDPREEPYCDAYYWADNLRHTVRFAAAVQAALEDGFPGLHRAVPAPAADACGRSDRAGPGHDGRRPGRDAPRAAAAARAARADRRPVHRGCRGGLLGALPLRSPGGCAAAGVDSPPLLLERALIGSCTLTPSRYTRCWARMCG